MLDNGVYVIDKLLCLVCGRNSVVECQLPKLDVGSSNLLGRFFLFINSFFALPVILKRVEFIYVYYNHNSSL